MSESDQGGDARTTRPGRRVRIALAASLVVNVFFAALLLGFFLAPHKHRGSHVFRALETAVEAGSPELKKQYQTMRRDFRRERGLRFKERLKKMRAIARTAAQEPFDPEAFAKALDSSRAFFAERRTRGNKRLSDLVTSADPATRKRFAAEMQKVVQRYEERMKRWKKK
ncbi:MAG: periplasmic heavy metal sensor [Neomegalonema sp.]|nr:periplasmic heavy metal sensor [Neomegalonema sp.]